MYRTPITCDGLQEWGNTIFAPVIGPTGLNTLCIFVAGLEHSATWPWLAIHLVHASTHILGTSTPACIRSCAFTIRTTIRAAICRFAGQLHGWARALRQLTLQEASRGARYDRVVASRLELLWLSPHPPLEVLGSECAWVPSGEDCKAHERGSNSTPKPHR